MGSFFLKKNVPYTMQGRNTAVIPIENHVMMWVKTCQHIEVGKSGDLMKRGYCNEVLYKNCNVVISNPFGYSIMFL